MAEPRVTRLHRAFRGRLIRLREQTLAQILTLPADDFDRWITEVVPVILQAQRSTVLLTDAYLSMEAGLATGTSTDPWNIDSDALIGAKARRGVLLEDVYGRNFAVKSAGTLAYRMAREVNTDITLAERSTTFVHTDGDPRIIGTRRILGSGPNCALCVVAATRTYKSETLRPIHSHCGCTSLPIYDASQKPPQVGIRFLDDLYHRAGSNKYGDLRRLSVDDSELPAGVKPENLPDVLVTDADELGPSLVAA